MKTALICPIPHLKTWGMGGTHLLLSHLCNDRKYRAHYKLERRQGAYLILDNSAHENKAGEKPEVIARLTEVFNPQEIVVPDVLFDSEQTIANALKAHEVWFENKSIVSMANPQLMYVPQGRTKAEWAVCLNELVRIHRYSAHRHGSRQRFTLGVSKDYEDWNGGLPLLFAEYIAPLRDRLHMEGCLMDVHLLGWGRRLWDLRRLTQKYPWIRSVDSAKPFVYAMAGIYLVYGADQPYPGRPEDFFWRKIIGHKRDIVRHNIEVFQQVAGVV